MPVTSLQQKHLDEQLRNDVNAVLRAQVGGHKAQELLQPIVDFTIAFGSLKGTVVAAEALGPIVSVALGCLTGAAGFCAAGFGVGAAINEQVFASRVNALTDDQVINFIRKIDPEANYDWASLEAALGVKNREELVAKLKTPMTTLIKNVGITTLIGFAVFSGFAAGMLGVTEAAALAAKTHGAGAGIATAVIGSTLVKTSALTSFIAGFARAGIEIPQKMWPAMWLAFNGTTALDMTGVLPALTRVSAESLAGGAIEGAVSGAVASGTLLVQKAAGPVARGVAAGAHSVWSSVSSLFHREGATTGEQTGLLAGNQPSTQTADPAVSAGNASNNQHNYHRGAI